MHDATKKRLVGFAALALVVGVALTYAKPALVDAETQRIMADAPAVSAASPANASAYAATPSANADPNHSFHVLYKRGFDEYVRGDSLTIEDGSYVVRENGMGIAQTVGVFPLASVDSVIAVSNEQTNPVFSGH